MKASKLLGIGASLVALAATGGGGQQDGLNVLVQHIRTIGPRQWIGLMTASLVPGPSVIAPLAERLAVLRAAGAIALTASPTRPLHPL
jgi:hypothetical protein